MSAACAGTEAASETLAMSSAENPCRNPFSIDWPSQTKRKHRQGTSPPGFMIIREDRTRQSIRANQPRWGSRRASFQWREDPSQIPHRGHSNYHNRPARVKHFAGKTDVGSRAQFWYVSKGHDVIFVTHLCEKQPETAEVSEAQRIVE